MGDVLKEHDGSIWAHGFKRNGDLKDCASRLTADQAAALVASGEAVWESHHLWIRDRATQRQVNLAWSLASGCTAPRLREWLGWLSRGEISTLIDLLEEGAL